MKLKKENILLILLFIAALVYAYGFATQNKMLIYFSKPLIAPTAGLFYISITPKIHWLFVISLFFTFLGNVLMINPTEGRFVLGMGSTLLFIVLNMLIIAEEIGEMNTTKFFKITLIMVAALTAVQYFLFTNAGQITLLFHVFGGILAIYASFAIYLYLDKKDNASLFNLIGTSLFIMAAIARGLDRINISKVTYRLINIALYTLSLYFIAKAYAESASKVRVKSD